MLHLIRRPRTVFARPMFLAVASLLLATCFGGEFAVSTDPQLVSAVSISNTQVLVQFSESVKPPSSEAGEGAENPLNYSIVTSELNTRLPVISAEFDNAFSATVLLTTGSQSGHDYKLDVANIRDTSGNPIAAPTQFIDPSKTTFVGTEPGPDAIRDTDGDGLPDHVELAGWVVTVKHPDGTFETHAVTSEPTAPDTDEDGVTDNEELHAGTDPRAEDTDGDTLTDNQEWNVIYSDPTHQDTDGDGTQDGFEFFSFRTSPVLADTDGDQIDDTEEVLGRNRNPRISDVPRAGISVGEVRLQIDERFTFEDAQGTTITEESSSSSTLAQSENDTFASSNTDVTQHVASARVEAGFEGPGGRGTAFLNGAFLNIEGGYEYTNSNSFTSERSSAIESQRVHQNSLNKSKQINTTSTVTREVVGARIDIDLTIKNAGDLAFSISNLEVTVLQRDRQATDRFVPVATLIANSTLITGAPAAFNIGPFTPERGPILFSSQDVFPNLVEELMKQPEGLIFKVANFDMTDEFGRVFSFANQVARDRTAGIIVDTGDGEPIQYLVATALQPDPGGFGPSPADDAFPHVGGFNSNGSPLGIPLDFALQDTLGLSKNSTVQDGIVAGPNRRAESIAQGDDVQLIPPYTTGVGVGSVVISAGQNGILETPSLGDDEAEVTTGYETSPTCDAASVDARQICSVDSDCTGGTCTGPEVLVRFGSYRTGDFNRVWVVLTTREIPAGADFGKVTLKPGADIFLAFVQDLDQDGLFAREEYMSGSTDSRADDFNNSLFGADFDENAAASRVSDGLPDASDTDRDGIGDFAEVRLGWKVAADGGALRSVFSSPRLRDSDGDGLLDPVEMDLRAFCSAGDPRTDGLCGFLTAPVTQGDAVAIIAGPNGVADTVADADDVQLLNPGVVGLTFGAPVIGVGSVAGIQTVPQGDDVFESLTGVPPATDPSIGDTDQDSVSDFDELAGFNIGLSIRDGGDQLSETQVNGDDVRKAFFNNPVKPNGIVILPGANGVIDSCGPQDGLVDLLVCGLGDDVYRAGSVVVTDPLRRDTDGDLVADGSELDLGGDPTDPFDGQDFRDSDQDGLTDSEEADLGWLVSVDGLPGVLVKSNPSLVDSDLDGLPDFIERDIRSNPNNSDTDGDGLSDFDEFDAFEQYFGLDEQFLGFSVDGSTSARFGTDVINTDTDNDGLTDHFELLVGYQVLLNGEPTFRHVLTSPFTGDTDFDGATDFEERAATPPTDATDPDTDDDGRTDGQEQIANTDPLVPDLRVTVRYSQIQFAGTTAGGDNFQWFLRVQEPGQVFPGTTVFNHTMPFAGVGQGSNVLCGLSQEPLAPNRPGDTNGFFRDGLGNAAQVSPRLGEGEASFALHPGQSFALTGYISEVQSCPLPGALEPLVWNCQMNLLKFYTYEEISQAGSINEDKALTAPGCNASVVTQIFVN